MNKKLTVLVVEDDSQLLRAIITKLTGEGIRTLSARSVPAALKYLAKGFYPKPDVIWLDHYLLGDENGLDLVATIKPIQRTADIPIVVVSNSASSEKIAEYHRQGIFKYIGKAETSLAEIVEIVKQAAEKAPSET